MRFSDLIDPRRGPEALVRLALYPLIVLVVFAALSEILSQLPPLLVFLAFIFLSPVAYLIRKARRGRTERQGARRGAERTPLLPHNEEDQ